MGILDDALDLQNAKRSQRMRAEARKAKIQASKIKEGTYRGVDLTDGTARIQLDGQSTITSGYRLISNAPLGNGDRVAIRPNGVALPRADARNVAPPVAEDVAIEQQFVFLDLRELSVGAFTSFDFFANSLSLQKQRWTVDSQGNAKTFDGWERPTFPENVFAGSGFEGATYQYSASKEWIELTTDLGSGITNTVLIGIIFSLPSEFNKILDELDLIDENISPTSKLEAEIESSFGTLDQIFFDADIFAFSAYFSSVTPISATPYTFRFRYRRRGATRWFQL